MHHGRDDGPSNWGPGMHPSRVGTGAMPGTSVNRVQTSEADLAAQFEDGLHIADGGTRTNSKN